MTMGACAGLRILDLGTGRAGALATMILADYGADVVRVETADAPLPLRGDLPVILNRGKTSLAIDIRTPAGCDALLELIPSFDAIVDTARPGELEALGLDHASLARINPRLVQCSITGFGRKGPLAGMKADDSLAMAKSGILRDNPGWFSDGTRPVFRAGREASHFAAMLTVQGLLAALRVRDATGRGQHVDIDLLTALTCRINPKVRWLLREGEDLPLEAGAGKTEVQSDKHVLPHHLDPRQVNLIGMRAETKDGRWLMHSHTEPHFFPAWIDVLGLDWIWQDERFKGAPYKFPDTDTKLELVNIIQKRMMERTADEWMAAYVANGNVCGDAVQTTAEALRHPQVVESGLIAEYDDPQAGPVTAIGPLAKMPGAPAVVTGRDAAKPAEPAKVHSAASAEESISSATPALPLEGVTIIEAAYYYATPFATSLLSELGARVIRIEPPRGDPYRALANAGVGDPVLNLGHNNMVRAMQGKESIQLNLKDPRGREVFYKLIGEADVFIHCFRKGVPESLGIDYETRRAINPRLVYQYGASYGSTGPYARQPAIDPVIAAFAGTTAYQAGAGNDPLTETGADPVAAAGHAAAMMLGLFARDRTGQGQYVESAMIVTNIYLNIDDAFACSDKQVRPEVDHQQFGIGATHRLYETARLPAGTTVEPYKNPDPHWVFLVIEDDAEFARFCSTAGLNAIGADARFATRDARAANDMALTELLGAAFLERSAHDWEVLLMAADVGCVMADEMSNFAFLYQGDHARAADMMTQTCHPSLGTYWRHAPLIRFSQTPGRAGGFCEAGEQSVAILAELGYDRAAAQQLRDAGVVTWPTDSVEMAEASS